MKLVCEGGLVPAAQTIFRNHGNVVDAKDAQSVQGTVQYASTEDIPSDCRRAQQQLRRGMMTAGPCSGKISRLFFAPGPGCDSHDCTDVHCVSALPDLCGFDDQPS
jgi:hypothetical protein